jgi:ankyrin repeat protein
MLEDLTRRSSPTQDAPAGAQRASAAFCNFSLIVLRRDCHSPKRMTITHQAQNRSKGYHSHSLQMPIGSASSLSSPGQQLIDACESGDLVAVRKLLDEGVNVNWENEKGDTALICAISINSRVQIIKLLLDRGAQIDFQNKYGATALIWASYFGEVESVRLLLEKGADMSIKSKKGNTAKDIAKREGKSDIIQLLDEVYMLPS